MIFFTSDTHFGHKNIIRLCNRPFETIEEHDEALIDNWNGTVGPDDEIYHLGDVAFLKRGPMRRLLERLNGQIHLVLGNHDRILRDNRDMWTPFVTVTPYNELKVFDEEGIDGGIAQPIILFHYPIESWNKRHHGSWHLHGHCHGTLPSGVWQKRVDVGVDVWGYRPVSYEQIKAHMAGKKTRPVDHHGRE